MDRCDRCQRDPWDAQRVGDDYAMQSLSQQCATAGDLAEDGTGVAARIDQRHAGSGGRGRLCAARQAFEVRHETDDANPGGTDARDVKLGRAPFVPGRGTHKRQQAGRITEAESSGQTELTRCARTADPVDLP